VLALNSCNKAAATSVVDIEHIDDDEETMSISTLTSATASTGIIFYCTSMNRDTISLKWLP
jgi:hypothetical protein